jgi:hypothetical protein
MKPKIKNAAKITKLKSVKAKKIDVPSVKAAKKELTKAEKKVSMKKAQLILAKKAAKK